MQTLTDKAIDGDAILAKVQEYTAAFKGMEDTSAARPFLFDPAPQKRGIVCLGARRYLGRRYRRSLFCPNPEACVRRSHLHHSRYPLHALFVDDLARGSALCRCNLGDLLWHPDANSCPIRWMFWRLSIEPAQGHKKRPTPIQGRPRKSVGAGPPEIRSLRGSCGSRQRSLRCGPRCR